MYYLYHIPGKKMDNLGLTWKTSHGNFTVTKENIQWIMANAKTSMFDTERSYIYNKAFYEAYFNPEHTPAEACCGKTSERFDLIRDWAATRGLYEKGDPNTQYVKLQEECGELAKAMLQDDKPEIVDAIGDIVVVLTNLAHLQGYDIEHCIDEAYKVIAARTGKMINGTFVKDK